MPVNPFFAATASAAATKKNPPMNNRETGIVAGATAAIKANGKTITATQNNNLLVGTIIAARRFAGEFVG